MVISWLPKKEKVYKDKRLRADDNKIAIENNIREQLSSKGFQFRTKHEGAEYLIAYTAALESGRSDQKLLDQYGLMMVWYDRSAIM